MENETIKRKNIGEKIRQARVLSGISQKTLGKALHVNSSAVSKIESGIRAVTAVELEKIAKATNKDIDFFYEEEPEEKKEIKSDNDYLYIGDLTGEQKEALYNLIEVFRRGKDTQKNELEKIIAR